MPVWEQGADDSLHEAKRAIDRAIYAYENAPRGVELSEQEGPLFETADNVDTAVRAMVDFGAIAQAPVQMEYRTIYHRDHEMGTRPRIRVWTSQQAAYGQFEVIENAEFVAMQRILGNMGYIFQEGDE